MTSSVPRPRARASRSVFPTGLALSLVLVSTAHAYRGYGGSPIPYDRPEDVESALAFLRAEAERVHPAVLRCAERARLPSDALPHVTLHLSLAGGRVTVDATPATLGRGMASMKRCATTAFRRARFGVPLRQVVRYDYQPFATTSE